jgi:hypothetical protein
VTQQFQQVRGVQAQPVGPANLPHTTASYPETVWRTIFKGEAQTPPLMKPSGPGTLMTSDPVVIQNTLQAIAKALAEKPAPAARAELLSARQTLIEALKQHYPSVWGQFLKRK